MTLRDTQQRWKKFLLMIKVIKNIEKLQATDRILLDANACLIVFGPPWFRYSKREEDLIRYNKYIKSQNNWGAGNVYLCRPVLSEFINKCIDYFWKMWINEEKPPSSKNKRKDFRNSSYYKNQKIGDLIIQYVIDMLNGIEYCDSEFDRTKVCGFISEFKKCEMDFNDIIIEEICKENALALVTDDGDFKNCSITIFTANV